MDARDVLVLAMNVAGRVEIVARVPGVLDELDRECLRLEELARRGVPDLVAWQSLRGNL